ncbi:TetR/AcrR family transcriptional regulator [Streptomyces sp. Ru72]|uniref:TetR/AcrR family transcriptional regulator n=1 Tax=Streptomyces sp. Ru72 TaxID=2080747 RepID=UPI000CDD0D78|nr:TetR/AcrR family transcriptional regulator [Streptomyces sp. Ru72]POX43756.1 TetR family transcriptional regulator [Streptomyces sp. Ru72]
MNAIRTARERAREELVGKIKMSARHHLALQGAASLSLRAVARELGMASSAVYRYFPSRDDLITALIVDGFDSLGECAENAAAGAPPDSTPADRWQVVWEAVRAWAVANPHEYALLYGSPVPDYAAPQSTVGPAARVGLVLIGLVGEALSRGTLQPVERTARVAKSVAGELPNWAATRLVECWTQLFGLISFELFGHLHGVVEEPGEFFTQTVRESGAWLG